MKREAKVETPLKHGSRREIFRRFAERRPTVQYCSASEVRHLHFMTILKSFYCPVTAYMYTLPLNEAIPFI